MTGASRGIGRATAVALAGRGDLVAVHYGSDRAAAEETLGLLNGTGHTVVGGDLRGAFRGEPEFPAYGAAKAALHAFGQSMAVALAPHDISVASVAPGFVSSERKAAKLASPTGDAVRSESPFGRVGTPEEVAHAVLYLTSPGAVWASGAILDLNGASHLRT